MIDTYQLLSAIRGLGIQAFYNHTSNKDNVKFPFVIALTQGTRNFRADCITYKKFRHVAVILHTLEKDEVTEERLEKLFNDNKIPWNVSDEEWDSDLLMYVVTYNITL